VCQAIKKLVGIGIRSISLADTVGVADPDVISHLIALVTDQYPDYDTGVHLHSAPGEATAKVLAAYDAGCHRFDSAIGGLWGCPFAPGKVVGKIPTKNGIVAFLHPRGELAPITQPYEILTL